MITLLRFWQNKIHQDTDRRQTKSTIEFGSDGDSVKDPGEVAGGSRTEDEASKDGETEEEDEVRELGDYTYGGGQVSNSTTHYHFLQTLLIFLSFSDSLHSLDPLGGPDS